MDTKKDDSENRSLNRILSSIFPEIISFLLAFGETIETSTTNLYLVYSSCKELYPFRWDCGIEMQDDTDIQVSKTKYNLITQFSLKPEEEVL